MDPTNTVGPEVPLSAPEKKDGHWIAIAAMALFVAASLVAVGFLYYQNQQLKSMLAGYRTQGTPTPAATTDPTANWKTYTDQKYSFSFKYPGNFGNQGAIAGPFTGTSVAIRSFSDPATIREGTDAPFDGFNVYVVTNLNTTTFNEFINNEIKTMNSAEFAGMKNSTKSQISNGMVLTSESGSQAYYYLPTANQKQIIVFAYLQANPSFKQTFNQILSTFNFLSPTSSPSGTQKACTLEAKICPDGSSVGRTGPNCEFAACP